MAEQKDKKQKTVEAETKSKKKAEFPYPQKPSWNFGQEPQVDVNFVGAINRCTWTS